MKRRRLLQLRRAVACAVLICFPAAGHALGLGKLSVTSALDEPLEAEIALATVAESELGSVEVDLGSRSDFARAGVDLPSYLQQLQFEATTNANGDSVIRITSEGPLSEPFLHFLVAVEWAGGKLIREYTALLDPPLYAQGDAGSISSPRVPGGGVESTAQAAAPVAPPAPAPVAVTASAPEAPADAPAAPASTGFVLDPTQAGDTMWSIASKIGAPAGTSVYQLMVAIQQANPDAFIDGNLNRLKTGQILRVPDAAEVKAVTRQSAAREYQAQLAEWESYRLRTAATTQLAKVGAEVGTVEPATPVALSSEDEAPQADSLVTTASETATTPQKQDLLRLVRATVAASNGENVAVDEGVGTGADVAAAVGTGADALRAEIATLEESLVSRDLENRELREKVRLLEEQVQKASRLLEIESQNLALAQQAAAVRDAEPQPAAEPPSQAPQAQGSIAETRAEPTATVVGADPAPQQPEAVAAPVWAAAPRVVRAWWEGWRDRIVWNWQIIVLGVLGVAALVTGALIIQRRRRSMAEFEESVFAGSTLNTHSVNPQTGAAASATDTSFLSEFGVPGMGKMQADEVDPLAEAEVYIAYGRDEQAEEVLKEALGRDASRPELKLKLLEIYHKRNDVNAFEMLAEELYSAEGEQNSDIWARVTEMGRKVNPDNPLFKNVSAVAAGVAAAAGAADVAGAELMQGGGVNPREEPFPEPGVEHTPDDAGAQAEKSPARALDMEFSEPGDAELAPFPEPDREQFPDFGEIERRISAEGDIDIGSELDESLAALEAAAQAHDPAATMVAEGIDFGGAELELDEDARDALVLDDEDEQAAAAGSSGDDFFGLELETEDDGAEESAAHAWAKTDTEVEPMVDVSPLELTDEDLKGPEDEGDADSSENLQYSPWDESATKLDLAKAYLDMGDQSGARNIIDEVLREGNEGQRKQAAELAAQLAS